MTTEAVFDIKIESPSAAFSLNIVDNLGKIVLQKSLKIGKEQRVQVDVSALANGIYWARLVDVDGGVLVVKSFVKN